MGRACARNRLFVQSVRTALVCLTFSVFAPEPAQAASRRAVVVLYGESRALPAAVEIDETLRSGLGDVPDLDVFTEFLDLSWGTGGRFRERLVAFLREKYAGRRVDVVVPVAANALRLALEHRAELFPGVPIVFCALADKESLNGPELGADVTGVWTSLDAASTLEIARRLQPDLRRAVVVGGASSLDLVNLENVHRDLARSNLGLEVSRAEGRSVDELKQELAALPPHSAVLFVTMLRDATGRALVPGNALAELSAAASAPTYCLHEQCVGRGAVGGRVISLSAQAKQTVQIVRRVLDGEAASAIPSVERTTNVDVFDWRAMRRWGFSEDRLPPGSMVRFREPSAWERYRWHITGGVSVIAAQAALIGLLATQVARRRRAERAVAERLRFESLYAEVSATFARLAPAEIERGIEESLRRLGEHLDLDRVSLAELSADGKAGRVTTSWVSPGAPPGPSSFDLADFPWTGARIRSGSAAYVSRLAELPPEAEADRAAYAALGVRSIAILPLMAGDSAIGAIGLTTVRIERAWPPDLVQRAQLVAGLLADALARSRVEAEVQRLRRDLAHVGRVATMGELTASLAHELRQPLTAIRANAEAARRLLDAGTVERAELLEILSDVVADDERAGELITRLRSLFRKDGLERAALDATDVIREVLQLVRSDAIIHEVTIALELKEGLPYVMADRVQVQQVLLNLIVNALDAMRGVARSNRRLVIGTVADEGGFVRVWVRDRGRGIPEGELARILEPFHTSKPDGMGMGLSIARSIVDAHGGRLWAENNPDGGATFSFLLPVADDRARHSV